MIFFPFFLDIEHLAPSFFFFFSQKIAGAQELHELQKSVIGEWLLVNGEVVPFGPIVYAFGEETNHHSTTHHSTKMVHRLHRFH